VSKDEKPRARFEIFKDEAGKFRWRLILPNDEEIASGHDYESLANTSASIEATRIAESGVRAAQESHAPSDWVARWSQNDVRPMLRDSFLEALEIRDKRESTWSNRIKKAFWYVVGIIATAIVTYYVALAGFKV
jgi:uncharacterized protein YegP (UPF0339 family)